MGRRWQERGWYAVEECGAAVAAAGVGTLWKIIVGGGGGREGVGTMWKNMEGSSEKRLVDTLWRNMGRQQPKTVGWYAVEEYGAAVAAAGVGTLWKVIVGGGGGGREGVGTMWKIIWTKIVVWSHYQWHLLLCGVEHCMVA